MKSWVSGGMLAATIALPALSGAAWADDFTCSNATLQGEYAFGVTNLTTQSVAAGIKYFDGNGNMKQQDYRGGTGGSPPAVSQPGQEIGKYQVNSDCTGVLETQVAVGTVVVLFVISDGGRHIHEVVASLTNTAGANVAVQTSADDWKVAPEQDQQQ